MTPESAEILGLQGLGWLVANADGLEKFLRVTGTEGADLRAQAEDPHFLGAVLEFLLAHEELVADFCQDNGIRSADVHAARHVLER